MENWSIAWLDRLPPWPQVLLICTVFVGVTWLGIVPVHPVLRRLLHGDGPSNETIIFSGANFGLFYAVLLGLLTIENFQSTKDVLSTIDREASNLSTLYSAAGGYPNPLRAQLKGELRDYARYVIDKDWPAHRRGIVPSGPSHLQSRWQRPAGRGHPVFAGIHAGLGLQRWSCSVGRSWVRNRSV